MGVMWLLLSIGGFLQSQRSASPFSTQPVGHFGSPTSLFMTDTSSMPTGPPKIVIAGAPASGKGTQCEKIQESFGAVHLSTGDMLRAAVKAGTDLGMKAKEYMDDGQLVPDELITGVICDRLKEDDCVEKGWLLDGFPRTKAQADALMAAGCAPDCFILLDVPEEALIERVTGRRTDPETGKIYHMTYNPPSDPAVLARLEQRSDDTADKVSTRFQEFETHISAIESCFTDRTIKVDGTADKSQISEALSQAIAEFVSAPKFE